MRLLDQLSLPGDLVSLSRDKMDQIAGEIREEIIQTVSETGGHLGPSLGVVELTLALHAELVTPRDKIIWDVGHQSYAHKIVTGRLPSSDNLVCVALVPNIPYDLIPRGHKLRVQCEGELHDSQAGTQMATGL